MTDQLQPLQLVCAMNGWLGIGPSVPSATEWNTQDASHQNDNVETVDLSRSALMLWVPPEQRDELMLPMRKTILGAAAGAIQLDLSDFAHGKNWTKCYTP